MRKFFNNTGTNFFLHAKPQWINVITSLSA